MPPALIYLGFCIGLAFLGRNRKFGFWGYFFASLLFSPFVGAVLVLASDKQSQPEEL
jgi:hypothetical protein